jgi:hypothetical protein
MADSIEAIENLQPTPTTATQPPVNDEVTHDAEKSADEATDTELKRRRNLLGRTSSFSHGRLLDPIQGQFDENLTVQTARFRLSRSRPPAV